MHGHEQTGTSSMMHPTSLLTVLIWIGVDISDHTALEFMLETDAEQNQFYRIGQADILQHTIQRSIAEGRTMTLNITWPRGSGYFDLAAYVRKADQLFIDWLNLQDWQVICAS
jgi:hypothetical protein